MNKKNPIDRIRESSGHATVGTEEDGAILEMKNIGGRLLIIKEKAIYEMIFADKIDPEKTNINLPPTIQKLIINQGTESETVSRVLLTGLTLFKTGCLIKTIDCNKLISLTIDLLSEISVFEKAIEEYQNAEKLASDEYYERKKQKVSFKLPSVSNLESNCKTIFQKGDHIEQTLMEIITNFYPNEKLTKQSHFPQFHEILKNKYSEKDPFTAFILDTLNFMQIIRELRNGLDHRLDHTKVFDFELKPDGDIISPSLELNHKKVKLEKISLSEFLNITHKNILDIVEITFAYLAGKNSRTGGLQNIVKEIPLEKRRNKYVRYCFWSPIGKDGFFSQ